MNNKDIDFIHEQFHQALEALKGQELKELLNQVHDLEIIYGIIGSKGELKTRIYCCYSQEQVQSIERRVEEFGLIAKEYHATLSHITFLLTIEALWPSKTPQSNELDLNRIQSENQIEFNFIKDEFLDVKEWVCKDGDE